MGINVDDTTSFENLLLSVYYILFFNMAFISTSAQYQVSYEIIALFSFGSFKLKFYYAQIENLHKYMWTEMHLVLKRTG